MYLDGYSRVEIFGSKCNLSFTSLFCHAYVDRDLAPLLPYLNARLGGHEYLADPPALIFKVSGRLITIHADKIAINALEDKAMAHKLLDWLLREINETHDNMDSITPCYTGAPKPNYVRLLSYLPRTNCGDCGAPTCLVFASRLVEGAFGPEDCPPLAGGESESNRPGLDSYLKELRVGQDWI